MPVKKILIAGLLSMFAILGYAAEQRDLADLLRAHTDAQNAIKSLERARAANHYDSQGHAAKAEQMMHDVEAELKAAIDTAKKDAPKK